MKKMNNKGFLLAESLVVSTFVLTVLVLLFVQFRGLFNSYEDSYAYNTVEGIYNLNTMKKYIINNDNPDEPLVDRIGSNGYVTIVQGGTCQTATGLSDLNYCDELASAMQLQTLLYTSSNISSLNTNADIFTQSFKDFLSQIKNSDNKNRLIGQFEDGTYATIVFDNNLDVDNDEDDVTGTLMTWTSSSTSDFHSSTYKRLITSAEVVDSLEGVSDAVVSWDVSEEQNESVMAWLIDDPNKSGYYKLYIGGDGGVKAGTSLAYMFYNIYRLESIDLTKLDTSNVTDMSYMFYNVNELQEVVLSSFDTSKVTNMSYMFYFCDILTSLDISSFDTSKVTNMSYMFYSASSLEVIYVGSGWKTDQVTNDTGMFMYCGVSGVTRI